MSEDERDPSARYQRKGANPPSAASADPQSAAEITGHDPLAIYMALLEVGGVDAVDRVIERIGEHMRACSGCSLCGVDRAREARERERVDEALERSRLQHALSSRIAGAPEAHVAFWRDHLRTIVGGRAQFGEAFGVLAAAVRDDELWEAIADARHVHELSRREVVSRSLRPDATTCVHHSHLVPDGHEACPVCGTSFGELVELELVAGPEIFDCGCSWLKVEAGMCDIYDRDGQERERPRDQDPNDQRPEVGRG